MITEIDPATYRNYGIVRPPREDDGDTYTKLVRLVVDSRDRQRNVFPNPNLYEVPLPHDLHNVTFVKLIASCMPFVAYTVNKYNNKVHFTVAGRDVAAGIEVGDYSNGDDLAGAVEKAMNESVGHDQIFQVAYNTKMDSFAFNSTRSFSVNFTPSPSAAAMMGFAPCSYASSVESSTSSVYKNVVKSPYRMNLGVNNDAIVVNIDMLDLNVSSMPSIHGSFAILNRPGDGNGCEVTDHDHEQICKYFAPPLRRLSKMSIKLTDIFGHPWDTQNRDHRLEFLIETSLKQRS